MSALGIMCIVESCLDSLIFIFVPYMTSNHLPEDSHSVLVQRDFSILREKSDSAVILG